MDQAVPSSLAALLVGVALVLWARRHAANSPTEGEWIATLVGAAFALRLILHVTVLRSVALFAHGAGGDAGWYELLSALIERSWRVTGVRFVTASDMPQVGNAALVPNLLALIRLMIGGSPAVIGTVVVAAGACAAAVILYRFARDSGAARREATWLACVLLFTPSFVYYTSDVYKDGLVLLFVVVNVVSSVRLADTLRLRYLLAIGLASTGLWYVRNYLVYVSAAVPLTAFAFGGRSARARAIAALAALVGVAALASPKVLDNSWDNAEGIFQVATAAEVVNSNATGGSGVTFASGAPWSEFHKKLAYTLLSPFPWMGGSTAVHLGKVDAIVFCAALVQAARTMVTSAQRQPAVVAALLSFIIPSTVAYAASVSNVGLVVRQRMPIVACVTLLAALGTSLVRSSQRS